MASAAQINANRANAMKSTGPRTEEGKQRSSRNAVTHGLAGESPLIPGESPDVEEEMYVHFAEELQPAGMTEETLIWRMAMAHISMIRAQNIEKGLLSFFSEEFVLASESRQHATVERMLAYGFRQDCGETRSLQVIARYKRDAQREFDRALKQLRELQSERRAQPPVEPVVETNPNPVFYAEESIAYNGQTSRSNAAAHTADPPDHQ